MSTAIFSLILLVAMLHLWFLVLEMFLWRTPFGRRTFGMSTEKAETTSVLAANQGLYNGCFAAGLLISLFLLDPGSARTLQVFLLSCICAVGLYGGWSFSGKILLVQALPAAAALSLIVLKSGG